jgi:hypothetical protein
MQPSNYHKQEYGEPYRPVRPERCAVEVYRFDQGQIHQCKRHRGHGPEGAYCRQHARIRYRENSKAWNEGVSHELLPVE